MKGGDMVYTAKYVDDCIETMKKSGMPLQEVAWKTALNCVGWAYVYGARGQYCDPVNRRNYYNSHKDHDTIRTACKNFAGSDKVVGACSTCKWYPGGRTRFYDCRGFTYWVLKKVYDGWELTGQGATTQWETASNWKDRGEISTMPKDTLCCLFVRKNGKMEHTGFGLNNETIECSSGVQHFTSRNKKWTHWGVPVVIDGTIPTPTPTPTPEPTPGTRPTLRRGDKGPYVTLAQTELKNKGYDLGSHGVDGDFGRATEAAVKSFQKDNGLKVDGIIGPATWEKLDSSEPVKLYTVTIKHLTLTEADSVLSKYPTATKEEERI